MNLICQINADGDLLDAWFRHYLRMGVTAFHLIVHGSGTENDKLMQLKDRYPVIIRDSYEGVYSPEEKLRRTNVIVENLVDQWLLVVDSDEFVEFPYEQIATTIRMLEITGGNALFAPLLQHVTLDGSLDTPDVIEDPFNTFPLCSVSLYEKIGHGASISKYPLFYCAKGTQIVDGGNHNPPSGMVRKSRLMRGVTHHFKFRKLLLDRIQNRIRNPHSWRHESERLLRYLEANEYRLPLEESFMYSRRELFKRDLLRGFNIQSGIRWVGDKMLKRYVRAIRQS